MKNIPLLLALMMCYISLHAQNGFITTWKTDNPGVSNNNQITIPTFPGETYNYTVDWGDGTSDTGVTDNSTHSYASVGTYTVTITGLFPSIYFNNSGDKDKILTIEQWGNIAWSNINRSFYGCSNLDITNPSIDVPNLSNVSESYDMFRDASSFTGNYISNWDVSSITNMDYMFRGASSFNGDISLWNVSNVTKMFGMFQLANSFNQDISAWDVSNVTNMRNMFFSALSFNQDIGNWNVSKVTNMRQMFLGANSFNQNLGAWDISKVTEMENMFSNVSLSTINYDATIIGWATDSSGNSSDGIDDIPSNIIFSGGTSTYCSAVDKRDELLITSNWIINDGGQEPNCFITTWKTDNSGPSNNNQITIPTFLGETYDYDVYWGDGSVSKGVTGNSTHTFPAAGTYTVAITGLFPRIYFHSNFGPTDANKILTIEKWGNNPWSSMVFAFSFCSNLNITNPDIDSPNLSNTNNTTAMFNHCYNFNGSVSNWDVSTINYMQVMFRENRKFNQDISTWDVSNVNNMVSMFEGADDFDQNLGDWEIGNLINATDMFLYTGLSITNYDALLRGWATDSSGIPGDFIDDVPLNVPFHGGNSTYCLSESYKDNLSNSYNWNITDSGLDTNCINSFITTWNTIDFSGITNSDEITIPTFPGETYNYSVDWGDGTSDTGVLGDITHTYPNEGTYTVVINGVFPRIYVNGGNVRSKLLSIEQWGDNPWTSMENAFFGCKNLTINTIASPNLSNVENMTRSFDGCEILNSDLSNWDVSNVTNMSYMFARATNFNQDIGGWDVSNVQSMYQMFSGANDFNQDIGGWNVSNVSNFSRMFNVAYDFNQDISGWNVGNATNMGLLFAGAYAFNQDIDDWDTGNVINMNGMFATTLSFDHAIGNWDLSKVNNMTNMFLESGLSTSVYDATLMGWATDSSGNPSDGIDDIPSNINFNGGTSTYCISEMLRNELNTTYNWTITDLGLATDCVNGFITTWKTDNTGTSNDNQITIPTNPNETYNYTVDWGDGNTTTGITEDSTHTYAISGIYTITITGLFPSIYFNNSGDKDKILTIEQWGDNPWTSMESAFFGCSNLNITNLNIDEPNLNNVNDLTSMFRSCFNFNGDITNWDVSNTLYMNNMFYNANLFNRDISGWNVSNVEYMYRMFQNATNFNQDIAEWDVSNVLNMRRMFFYASSFNHDIEGWNVSKVTTMREMFEGATSFDQVLGNWDLSNITDMTDMMRNPSGISTSNYDATLMGWATDSSGDPLDGIDDIPSGINFNGGNSMYCVSEIFWNELDTTYNWSITDAGLSANCTNGFITTWKTDNLGDSNDNQITIPTNPSETYNYTVDWGDGTTDTGVTEDSMHTYANSGVYTVTITGLFPSIHFNNSGDKDKILTIEQWGDNPWSTMSQAFFGCSNLNITNQSIDAPNLSNVNSLNGMFIFCNSFNGDISDWDVSSITSMTGLFYSCSSFNQDISNWNVSNVIDMSGMFEEATNFNQDIGNWNVENVEYMLGMFKNATNFNQNLSDWNVKNLKNAYIMFEGTTSFDQDLGDWELSSMIDMTDMFLSTGISTSNYDATIIGWATDTSGFANDGIDDIPSNVIFNGGNSTYCAAEEAWLELDITYDWTITDGGLDATCNDIVLAPKVYLQGAYISTSALMRDDLRVGGHLPTITPYTDGVSCNAAVFTTTGNDAIVDWVFVELRDKSDNTSILFSQSALLQRDGDVVALDGTSDLVFAASADDYFVVIRHRNHLSVMSATVFSLSEVTTTVDFTNLTTQTYGTNAQATSGTPTGMLGMWSGNVNGDAVVQYSGTTPDAPSVLSQVLNDAGNFLNFPTYAVSGYNANDINMDGSIQYTGTTPDTPSILQNVLAHPGNFLNFSTYQIQEQLPEN